MLWERTDPETALGERFGFAGMAAMARWLTEVLANRWDLRVDDVCRVVISADNALAWARTPEGTFVVKVCADRERFARLGMLADVVTHLGSTGVPVPVPRPARNGSNRLQVTNGSTELSVVVQPVIAGDLLDVTDLDAVASTGNVLARLHTAAAALVPTYRSAGFAAAGPDLRARLHRVAHHLRRTRAGDRAPEPLRALEALLADLPALDGPATLVHNDVRGTNVLTRHSRSPRYWTSMRWRSTTR